MTLSSNNPPGRTMKFREADSTAGTGGSIPVKMQTRTSRSIKATLALAILSIALFALPVPAFAGTCDNANGDATAGQYCTPVESLEAGLGAGGEQPAETVAVPAETGPSLPFTGLDVAALAAVALALTGTGVVLRRLATIGDSEK